MATPEDRLSEAVVATSLGDHVLPDPQEVWLSRLSDATLLVLAVVAHAHGTTNRTISRAVGCSRLTVRLSLRRLERFELVERERRPGGSHWFATAEGTRLGVTPYVSRLLNAAKPFWAGLAHDGWSVGAFSKVGTEQGPPIFRPSVALADVNDPEALHEVIRTGTHDDRAYALTKLIALNDPSSAALLCDVAQRRDEDEPLARRAVIALGHFPGPPSVATLIAICVQRDSWMREAAARSLGRLRANEAVPCLIDLLQYPSAPVRAAAVRALGQIGGRTAATAIERARGDEDFCVRRCARHAHRQLGRFAEQPWR